MADSRLPLSVQERSPEGAAATLEREDAPAAARPARELPHALRWLTDPSRSALAFAAGLLLLHLTHPLTWRWDLPGVWFPSAGVGFVLAAWLGPRAAYLVAGHGLCAVLQTWLLGAPLIWGAGWAGVVLGAADAALSGLEVWAAWWCYFHLGRGLRGLIEPRSATLFLVLVPGALTFVFAMGHALLVWPAAENASFWQLVRTIWLSRALGIVALAPPCLVVASHGLARRGWIVAEPLHQDSASDALLPLSWGGRVEIAGLALTTAILGVFLTLALGRRDWSTSPLAMLPLLLIIWASLRQGVRGGTLVATAMAVPALTLLSLVREAEPLLTLQANLLAQGSTALLVGVSFNWIRASEARYRHVVEHVPVVLYSARLLTTSHGGIWPEAVDLTFVSPSSRQVFKRKPEEMLGGYELWLELVHPEDHELLQAALTQMWRFQEPVTCEYRLAVAPLRAERWLRDTFVPLLDEAGQLVGWEGVAQDITEQRHLADDLRRTTGMLHTLVNNLPAGVFFVEAAGGQPLLVNARARQLLGQREDPSAGLTHLAEVYRLHRADGSPYPAEQIPVCAALKRGTTSHCDDIVVHRPDGQRVPLVSWATPIDLGGLGRYDAAVWVLEDLTALRQAETALRESESRLRTVIENMAEGVLILDDKGTILDCNPAAGLLLDTEKAALQGRPVTEALGCCLGGDGAPLEPADHPANVCARTRRPVRDAVIGLSRSAPPATRWLLVRALPFAQGPRSAARVIVVFADITAQREAVAGQRRLEAGLEHTQRLGLIGQLSGGVAHDFNNYLTVLLTSSELVQQELPAEHAAQTDLRDIREAAEKASQLARQLTALSRSRPAAVQALDLNNLIERTAHLVRGTLGRTVHVELRLCPEAPVVHGRETELQQVLINLLLNARDAMPEGGRLSVTSELLEDATHGSRVRLRVADSGKGIAEDVRKNLFVAPVSDKECGAGLGLWMTRRIILDHGGQVAVESEPGRGTDVEIVLPAGAV